MKISLIAKLKNSFLQKFILIFSVLLPHQTISAESTLLEVPYTMPGQEAAIMLFAATQPAKPRGKELVLLSSSAGTGFGIYAFLFRFHEVIHEVINEERDKPVPVKRIMIGISDEAETVKRIFNFPADSNDILILEDEGISTISDVSDWDFNNLTGVAEARKWLLNSRLTLSLVNDELETLFPDERISKVPYAFFETLHHSENLESYAALNAEYERLTMALLSTESLDLEKSFRSLSDGYIEAMREYGEGLNYPFFLAGYPLQVGLARQFGLREYKIGLLLNKPESGQNYLNNLRLLSNAELIALTGSSDFKKALPFFLSGEYYLSYMHTLYANLQFIQTISLASSKRKLTLLMKMKAEDFKDPTVIDALRKVNITKVRFWSEKEGEAEFDLRKAPKDKHGFQIRIVNLFPTPEPLTQSLAYFSKPVVGTTGELSLFRVLSMGKLPLHEWMILQRYLNDEFANIARKHNLKPLDNYFRHFSPAKKAIALRQILESPSDIKAFTDILTTRYNASPFLKKLMEMTFNNSSPLWSAIAEIDEAIEQNTIHRLPDKLQDIAWVRVIASRFQELGQHPEVEDIFAASEDLKIFVEKIRNPLLRQILSQVPDKISFKHQEEEKDEDD